MSDENTTKPKRRPRGPGRSIPQRLARTTDRELATILRCGVPVTDPATGQVAVDASGKPVMRPAPAAYFNVAVRRIKDLGPAAEYDGESPQSRLLRAAKFEAARRRLRLFPPADGLQEGGEEAMTGS